MNRKVAIGCGIALLLFLIGVGAVIYIVPKLVRRGEAALKEGLDKHNRSVAFEVAWRPPAAALDASWFPKEVGAWKLTTQEPSKGILRLNIDRPGQYGAYQSGADVVEVNIMPANDLEKDALISRAQAALSGGSTYSSTMGNRSSVRTNGDDYTEMWWLKNWMFIFHKHGGTDPESFIEPYLTAVQAASPEAPAR